MLTTETPGWNCSTAPRVWLSQPRFSGERNKSSRPVSGTGVGGRNVGFACRLEGGVGGGAVGPVGKGGISEVGRLEVLKGRVGRPEGSHGGRVGRPVGKPTGF